MAFIASLTARLRSPSAVYNCLSGACTWVQFIGGSAAAFNLVYQVSIMKHGVTQSSLRVLLDVVIGYFRSAGSDAKVLSATLLMGYFTLLWQEIW